MSEPRRIVLTGATRGLGRAMTHGFISAGHTVLGCGRNAELIQNLVREYPNHHDFQSVDVANWEDVHSWAQRLVKQYGAPDLLINNASVMVMPAPLWTVSDAEFTRIMDINVNGTVNTIRAFVPAMIQRSQGIIINITSGWGRSTSPDVAPYCASKFAVEGLTQALAQELPDGLAAIPLNPGVINTDMLKECYADEADHYPTADEWAETAVPYILNVRPEHNGMPLTIH